MPIARCVVVPHLPANRAVAAVESDGEMVFAIAADRPAAEVAEQLTELMQAEIDGGTWDQTWTNPLTPPQLRQAV